MSRLGALGGSRAGLGLLLGTAAGLGFLCVLYSQRWKRTQRHGRSQSLPNSLDYAQASERGRQGKSIGHYLLRALRFRLSFAEQVGGAVARLFHSFRKTYGKGKPCPFLRFQESLMQEDRSFHF